MYKMIKHHTKPRYEKVIKNQMNYELWKIEFKNNIDDIVDIILSKIQVDTEYEKFRESFSLYLYRYSSGET